MSGEKCSITAGVHVRYLLNAFRANDAVAGQAARLLGAGGRLARVAVQLVLHRRQTSSDTSQLHLQTVGERLHLDTAQLAVNDARQKPDDATPLVVLSAQPRDGHIFVNLNSIHVSFFNVLF